MEYGVLGKMTLPFPRYGAAQHKEWKATCVKLSHHRIDLELKICPELFARLLFFDV